MADKAFAKLSRLELVDIIYTLQKNEQELKQQLQDTRTQLDRCHTELEKALAVADSALEIRHLLEGGSPEPVQAAVPSPPESVQVALIPPEPAQDVATVPPEPAQPAATISPELIQAAPSALKSEWAVVRESPKKEETTSYSLSRLIEELGLEEFLDR